MSPCDEDLWEQALRGDGEAFGAVFDRHRDRVRRHALGLVPVPADAEDVLAIVFLEAWRRRERVRFVEGSLLPWLLRTATYTANNLRRTARRHQDALRRLPPSEHTATAPEPGDADSDVLLALRKLSSPDQQIITLCVLEGLGAAEAGSVIGVRPGTVRTRLSRAKARLRQRLELPLTTIQMEGTSHVR